MARGMVPVELVEDDEPPPAGPPPEPWVAVAARAGLVAGRLAARVVAAGWRRPAIRHVALGVAAAVAAGLVVHAADERTRLEALAQVPGVVRPIGPDLAPLFVVDSENWPVVLTGFAFGDLVVGPTMGAEGRAAVAGVDAETGETRWTADLSAPGTPAGAVGFPLCAPVGAVLGCTTTSLGGSNEVGLAWVLDPADGRVLRRPTLGEHARAVVAGGLLVVAEQVEGPRRAPADGPWTVRWRVTGQDPVTGVPAWTWTGPEVAVAAATLEQNLAHDPTDYALSLSRLDAGYRRAGDDVALGVGTHTWVLGAGGVQRVELEDEDIGVWSLGATRSGGVARARWDGTGLHGETLGADGTWLPYDGEKLWLAVDDGSAPGLNFVSVALGDPVAITAYDAATGAVRWTTPVGRGADTYVANAMLLDGRLFVGGRQVLTALDAVTGEILWAAEPEAELWPVATDGSVLLTLGPDEHGATNLTQAFTLDDGRLSWSRDMSSVMGADASGAPRGFLGIEVSAALRRVAAIRGDDAIVVLG